ncbi:hypothetical protein BJF90_10210 [Pseudonocardia sp. CNS-004]|nr:hypothetical protein BJF90_10210 [Pseudonocardia sp. CNS-004]
MLLADVGASSAHLAVIDLSQRMLARTEVDVAMHDGPEPVLRTVETQLTHLLETMPAEVPVRAVVIGLPGPVDGTHGIPVRPPIMPGWHAYPVAARLSQTFRCPAVLENDVNLRALGEARALPADQVPLLFVKVGTGIGGGLVSREGVLHHGADGAAGDIGHVRVRGAPDDACVCGNVGCIEAVASAGASRGGSAHPGRRSPPSRCARSSHAGTPPRSRPSARPRPHRRARRHPGALLQPRTGDDRRRPLRGERRTAGRRAQRRLPARLPLATRNLVLTNSVLGEYSGLAGAAVLGIERVLSTDSIGQLLAQRA